MNRAAFICLAAAFLVLTHASLAWLASALMAPAARGNLIVMLALLALIIVRLMPRPQANAAIGALELRAVMSHIAATCLPLATVVVSAAAYMLARWATPWNRVHAVIALVGVYGLVGCCMSRASWRRALAVLALVVVALPFGEQIDVLVGYPLRLAITGAAQSILEALGAHGASRATLLVFESGAAQIDVPCSGVKSLWAGALLALAAPLVLRKRFTSRWLLATLALVLALVAGNILRIVVLVLLAVPGHQTTLAEVLHRPLGCVAFVLTAATYIAILTEAKDACSVPSPATAVHPAPVFAIAVMVVIAAWITPAAAASVHGVDETPFVRLPPALAVTPIALSSLERRFFANQGADRASKVQFVWNDTVHGSLIIVRSAHAAAQHPPEQCLTSAGHTIRTARTAMLGSTLSVRVLGLTQGAAVSWFQSGYATHGDYAERVWASGTWVQVSILLADADAEHVPADLVYALYRAIAATYQGDVDASAET
jgi:exosortase O